jgi:hypothetical protein
MNIGPKMTRVLYTIAVLALTGAGVLSWFSFRLWHGPAPGIGEIQGGSQTMKESGHLAGYDANSRARSTPPLIVQAEAFASYLRPPASAEMPPTEVPPPNLNTPVPPIPPVTLVPEFRLCATSFCPSQPSRSIALIREVGAPEGSERWVKAGTQVGHFIIHEIRRGAIVYRDGNNLREMAVEHDASLPSIVRDLRPGSLRVSAAVGGTDDVTPALAGPNGIGIAGGN